MTAFGLAARWTHLVCGLGLVGIFSAALLAGRSDRPTADAWASLTLRLARWLAATVLVAALLLLREREESAVDWTAWRIEAWALGAVAAAAMAWAGHAAAAEPLGLVAALADACHLVAAGLWLGALLPIALLLRAASRESGADSRPYAVLAVRRFSPLALMAMLAIVATGLGNAWVEVGSVPALVVTRYGRLLLVKIALLGPILGLAAANRRRLLPALSGDGATVGRPAMARLSRFIVWEL